MSNWLTDLVANPPGLIMVSAAGKPVGVQLDLIRTIMPKIKTIGVIYTSSDDSSAAEYREFKNLAEKHHITIRPYTITSTFDHPGHFENQS